MDITHQEYETVRWQAGLYQCQHKTLLAKRRRSDWVYSGKLRQKKAEGSIMLNENICLSLAWAERILNTSMTEQFIAGYYFYGISSWQGFLKILGRWN